MLLNSLRVFTVFLAVSSLPSFAMYNEDPDQTGLGGSPSNRLTLIQLDEPKEKEADTDPSGHTAKGKEKERKGIQTLMESKSLELVLTISPWK